MARHERQRPPELRAWKKQGGKIVDLFAGGGGVSSAIAAALGRSPDVAVNHWPKAIAMHKANHPTTTHFLDSVHRVCPIKATGGDPVALLWLSPDCTHFSKAKGGKPRSKKIRALAWTAIRWAKAVRPAVICLENVEELLTWGPLGRDGQPDPKRAAQTWRAWLRKLRSYGYEVEWKLLTAADYGSPTTRKRLFVVARCDGKPIRWPTPTHGKGRAKPWRAAAEIIDWSIQCPSIFERDRPYKPATLARIVRGIRRYVQRGKPFIVPVTHPRDARVHGIDEPLRTITGANRGELALVSPLIVKNNFGEKPCHGVDEPLHTVTTQHNKFALVSPYLIAQSWGERKGQAPRCLDIGAPLGTVVAGGIKHALCAALITKHYGGVVGHDVERPIGTITTQDHHSLTTAWIAKHYGTSTGSDMRDPLPTVTAGGYHLSEVRALLARFPEDRTNQGSLFEDDPCAVIVDGELYFIVDIGMRMLRPHELFRAHDFPPDYILAPEYEGKPLGVTDQVALCGNSVPIRMAQAVLEANVGDLAEAA